MKFVGFLTPRGFAVFLLIVSVVFLIIWRTYPDFYSPLFLITPAFLFLSISLCIANRMRKGSSRRNTVFWGSVVFHMGMLIVIAATSIGPLTRFSATATLPQGVLVATDDKRFFAIHENSLGQGKRPFINLMLNDFETRYTDERFPVEYTANISIGILNDESYHNFKENIEVNRPLIYDGYSFLLERGRYSPHLILRDKNGDFLFNGHVDISNKIEPEDKFDVPKTDITLYTRFFPDMHREGNKIGSRSLVPKNPAFGIKIVKRDEPFKDIWRGVLKKGEEVKFDNMTLDYNRTFDKIYAYGETASNNF